jgi:membrane-bound lytic murein transglycosylase B
MRSSFLAILLISVCHVEPTVISSDAEADRPVLLTRFETVPRSAVKSTDESMVTESELGIRSWSHLKSRSQRSRVSDGERDILMSAGADFVVPTELLYGIWSVESGRLDNGWHYRWPLAKLLPQYGSVCARRYGILKCRANWSALQRICAQKRNGSPICDPNRVRSSRAIALGSMQHLAIKWSPAEGEWGRYVHDYDLDGTFDPHSFADAVASSAGHLRGDYELAIKGRLAGDNAWRYAVRMYLGKSTAQSYERKVYRYARNWCSVPGYCD